MDRIIYHSDCNSFFASVEETFNPEYKKVPMAIGGDPESRHGIILAKNELAKKYNIKTAETIWSAKKKCPELLLCPPRSGVYGEFCERINEIYGQYTDLVERFGVDESFLDVTGSLHLFGGDPVKLAHEIRERIKREIGITVSVGVSWNKIFAKLGSDMKKPDAITVITRENYKKIVYPLPAKDLLYVGRSTAESLDKYGIHTIGQIAETDSDFLKRLFGKLGEQLSIFANGLDTSPVLRADEHAPIKSVGNGKTFRHDLTKQSEIKTGITALADSVASRLRKHGFKCTSIQVSIKDTNLQSITRQKPLTRPTFLWPEIAKAATDLLQTSWPSEKPIRAITITAQSLIPENQAAEQLSLFEDNQSIDAKQQETLEKTVDKIRDKFGKHSIEHAGDL